MAHRLALKTALAPAEEHKTAKKWMRRNFSVPTWYASATDYIDQSCYIPVARANSLALYTQTAGEQTGTSRMCPSHSSAQRNTSSIWPRNTSSHNKDIIQSFQTQAEDRQIVWKGRMTDEGTAERCTSPKSSKGGNSIQILEENRKLWCKGTMSRRNNVASRPTTSEGWDLVRSGRGTKYLQAATVNSQRAQESRPVIQRNALNRLSAEERWTFLQSSANDKSLYVPWQDIHKTQKSSMVTPSHDVSRWEVVQSRFEVKSQSAQVPKESRERAQRATITKQENVVNTPTAAERWTIALLGISTKSTKKSKEDVQRSKMVKKRNVSTRPTVTERFVIVQSSLDAKSFHSSEENTQKLQQVTRTSGRIAVSGPEGRLAFVRSNMESKLFQSFTEDNNVRKLKTTARTTEQGEDMTFQEFYKMRSARRNGICKEDDQDLPVLKGHSKRYHFSGKVTSS